MYVETGESHRVTSLLVWSGCPMEVPLAVQDAEGMGSQSCVCEGALIASVTGQS